MIVTEPSVNELERIFLNSDARILEMTVYETSWCHEAIITKAWLMRNQVPCRFVDIEQDSQAADKVQAWNHGFLSVPTLDITLLTTEPSSDQLLAAL
ncbi:MAG: glutaredoxin family protein, partial [Anaerolineae bacterium]